MSLLLFKCAWAVATIWCRGLAKTDEFSSPLGLAPLRYVCIGLLERNTLTVMFGSGMPASASSEPPDDSPILTLTDASCFKTVSTLYSAVSSPAPTLCVAPAAAGGTTLFYVLITLELWLTRIALALGFFRYSEPASASERIEPLPPVRATCGESLCMGSLRPPESPLFTLESLGYESSFCYFSSRSSLLDKFSSLPSCCRLLFALPTFPCSDLGLREGISVSSG